jgi:hypothetical protein
MLSTVPVKTRDLKIGLDFNFAKNKGVLEKLVDDVDRYPHGMGVYSYANRKLGDIVGSKYARSEDGQILIDDKGLMIRDSEENLVIGNLQADWTGSINLNADYKGFYLSALVSVQQGGDIFSSSEQGAVSAGTAERTLENNRMSFFVDGVTTAGTPNHVIVTAEEYWRQLASIGEEFIYDASHMKLKELAIGYNIPQSVLSRIPNQLVKSARISLVGRNLFYFYKDTPGTAPDASAYSTNYAAQAYDFAPVPSTRTYGFSLNVGF